MTCAECLRTEVRLLSRLMRHLAVIAEHALDAGRHFHWSRR